MAGAERRCSQASAAWLSFKLQTFSLPAHMGSLREPCQGSYALDPVLMVYSLADCWTEYLAWL